jgi:hypothetical protein
MLLGQQQLSRIKKINTAEFRENFERRLPQIRNSFKESEVISNPFVNRVHLENCSSFRMRRKNPHPPAPSPKFGRRGAAKLSLSQEGRGI